MPVRIIGMIGVSPPAGDATLHVLEGGLSPDYVTQFARAHDAAGFDLALVGYTSSSAEGFLTALYAAMQRQAALIIDRGHIAGVVPTALGRLDPTLRIKRFTPPLTELFNITTGDTPHLFPTVAQLPGLIGGIYQVQRNSGAASSLTVPLAPATAFAVPCGAVCTAAGP